MCMRLVLIFLPLLLLGVIIPVTASTVSVQLVVSFRKSRTTQNGPVRCALDQANETSSSCSLEDCSLNCARDDTCTGFNTKNSLTCDHVMTPALASTLGIHSPVSHDDTCSGFNIKNSLTCDVYNYKPKITGPVSDCSFYQVDNSPDTCHVDFTTEDCIVTGSLKS